MIAALPLYKQTSRSGFVLPLVLVFILTFSTVTFIGMRAAQKGQTLTRALLAENEAQWALFEAEKRAIFQALTTNPVIGGFDLARIPDPDSFSGIDGPLPRVGDERNLWSAQGGIRQDQSGVLIRYQDTAGLVSVNDFNGETITKMLEAMGQSGLSANQLAARLLDYTDEDRTRRFQGAEAPAYRLLNRKEPTQSPLRTISELRNILGWDDEPGLWKNDRLTRLVTTDTRSYGMVGEFLAPELQSIGFQLGDRSRANSAALPRSPIPSSRIRLSLSLGYEGVYGPQRITRTIEIERRAIAADRPYYRYLIAERMSEQNNNEQNRSYPPLVPAIN